MLSSERKINLFIILRQFDLVRSSGFVIEGFQDFASFCIGEHLLPFGSVRSISVEAFAKLVRACRLCIQLVALGQDLVDFFKVGLALLHLKKMETSKTIKNLPQLRVG